MKQALRTREFHCYLVGKLELLAHDPPVLRFIRTASSPAISLTTYSGELLVDLYSLSGASYQEALDRMLAYLRDARCHLRRNPALAAMLDKLLNTKAPGEQEFLDLASCICDEAGFEKHHPYCPAIRAL